MNYLDYRKLQKCSKPAIEFENLWKNLSNIKLIREFPFAKGIGRRFRFDFAHLSTNTAIEIEGIGNGRKPNRHTSFKGYTDDCKKYNLAIIMGWNVFRLTPAMITEDNLLDIIAHIEVKQDLCTNSANHR